MIGSNPSEGTVTEDDAKAKIRRFFQILDIKEESDSGRVFSPVYISSCRVLLTEEMNGILKDLKEYSRE